MERNIKDVNSSVKEVEISLSNEELQPHFDKALHELQPNVEIKGFRKGKVPMNVVKQRYGQAVEADSMQDISNDEFQKFVQEENIPVVGAPGLIDINKSKDGVKFTIRYEILPEFDLKLYNELKIDEPTHTVKDEEVDEQITMICKNSGDMVEEESVEDEEFVVGVKIYELDEETGMALIDKDPQSTHVYLADPYILPGMKAKLMGTKVGDSISFKPKDEGDPNAPDKEFKVSVTEVKRLVPKEFNDDFVKEYTQGKFDKTDDFKEEIHLNLQEQWDEKARKYIEEQIMTKLVDEHDFDLPDSVVHNAQHKMAEDLKKQYANDPNTQNIDVNQLAHSIKPLAERTVKWEIIRKAIIDKEKLEVEDFDIDELAQQQAAQMNIDKETVIQAIKQNENISAQILGKKVVDLILDFAETEEMDFDDYEKKYKLGKYQEQQGQAHDHDHNHDHDHDHGEEGKSNIIIP